MMVPATMWLWMMLGCSASDPTFVWFGGDVHLGSESTAVIDPTTSIRGLGVVNLEGPIASVLPAHDGQLVLSNHAGAPAALAASGIAAVGVANNHHKDAGKSGYDATLSALKSGGLTPIEHGVPTVVGGVTVIPLDGERVTDGLAFPAADPLVVSLHTEGDATATVDAALAAGADLVVVHGSHRIGRFEERGGGWVHWGLGNLVFNCECTDSTEGAVVQLTLVDGEISDLKAIPVAAGLHGKPARLVRLR